MRLRAALAVGSIAAGLFAGSLLAASGCASGQMQCKEVETGRQQCVQTGNKTDAAITGAAAGALWVGGGGCKIGGCRPPMVCNERSGYCEHQTCTEDSSSCPSGTMCDSRTHTCR